VVTTLEPAPLRESNFLIDELRNRSFRLSSVIANRVTPIELLREVEGSLGSLQQSIQDPLFVQAVVSATESLEPSAEQVARVVTAIAQGSEMAVEQGKVDLDRLRHLGQHCDEVGAQLHVCAVAETDLKSASDLVAIGDSVKPA
jgi:hypothetical protein